MADNTRPLSPAAQAAWDAYNDVMERGWFTSRLFGTFEDYDDAIAAAFRAVAHHLPNDRRVLAAIADELQGRANG
jgi:hypothetical protein